MQQQAMFTCLLLQYTCLLDVWFFGMNKKMSSKKIIYHHEFERSKEVQFNKLLTFSFVGGSTISYQKYFMNPYDHAIRTQAHISCNSS